MAGVDASGDRFHATSPVAHLGLPGAEMMNVLSVGRLGVLERCTAQGMAGVDASGDRTGIKCPCYGAAPDESGFVFASAAIL